MRHRHHRRNALLASIVKGKKLRRVEGSSPGRTPSAPSAKLNASVSDAAAMLSRALSNKFSNARASFDEESDSDFDDSDSDGSDYDSSDDDER